MSKIKKIIETVMSEHEDIDSDLELVSNSIVNSSQYKDAEYTDGVYDYKITTRSNSNGNAIELGMDCDNDHKFYKLFELSKSGDGIELRDAHGKLLKVGSVSSMKVMTNRYLYQELKDDGYYLVTDDK
jgi:hypothetical protein